MMVELGGAAAVFVAMYFVGRRLNTVAKQYPKPNRRASDKLEAGERIRFLCAIPEIGVEAGEEGRIYMIYPGDDLEYWVVPDRDTSKRTKFFDYELWQIERVET